TPSRLRERWTTTASSLQKGPRRRSVRDEEVTRGGLERGANPRRHHFYNPFSAVEYGQLAMPSQEINDGFF
ncbi:MAG: hypothetical protein ACREX9_06485, partial [Gammaproteobacteria bacterium]